MKLSAFYTRLAQHALTMGATVTHINGIVAVKSDSIPSLVYVVRLAQAEGLTAKLSADGETVSVTEGK